MHKNMPVYTEDDVLLGELLRIIHRLENIDPDLALYESYLVIWDVHSGQRVYVPINFVDTEQPDKVTLFIDLDEIQEDYWGRIPPFVAGRRYRAEELPVPA